MENMLKIDISEPEPEPEPDPETSQDIELEVVTPLIFHQPTRQLPVSDHIQSLLQELNEFHIVMDTWFETESYGVVSFREPIRNRAVWRGELEKTGLCTLHDDCTQMAVANLQRQKVRTAKARYIPETVCLIRKGLEESEEPYARIKETDEEMGAFVWTIELLTKFRTISISQFAKEFLCLRVFSSKYHIQLTQTKFEGKLGSMEIKDNLMENKPLRTPCQLAVVKFCDFVSSSDRLDLSIAMLGCIMGRILANPSLP